MTTNSHHICLLNYFSLPCSKSYQFHPILVSCNKCLKTRIQTSNHQHDQHQSNTFRLNWLISCPNLQSLTSEKNSIEFFLLLGSSQHPEIGNKKKTLNCTESCWKYSHKNILILNFLKLHYSNSQDVLHPRLHGGPHIKGKSLTRI